MIPVTNNTKMPIYVGAAMVPAGETRLFHEDQVPVHLRPAPEVAAPEAPEVPKADPVAALAKEPAKAVIAALATLSNEQLDQLAEIEQGKGDKARTSVLGAISEETLKRAEGGGA